MQSTPATRSALGSRIRFETLALSQALELELHNLDVDQAQTTDRREQAHQTLCNVQSLIYDAYHAAEKLYNT